MDCSTPGLPVHHQLLELTWTHVHWVGDAIQPSHLLSSPSLYKMIYFHPLTLGPHSSLIHGPDNGLHCQKSISVTCFHLIVVSLLSFNLKQLLNFSWIFITVTLFKITRQVFYRISFNSVFLVFPHEKVQITCVINPEYPLEGLMLKLKLQYFGHLMRRIDSLEKILMLGKIEAGEGDNRGWDGWMASPTRWTWVWASSRSWWWTGRPGML